MSTAPGRTFVFEPVAAHDVAAAADVSVSVHVPDTLRWLEGHFPGDPIVPGIAQLLPLVAGAAQRAFPALGPPRGCSRVKFHRRLDPGASLRVVLSWAPSGAPGAGTMKFSILAAEGDSLRSSGYLRFEPGGGMEHVSADDTPVLDVAVLGGGLAGLLFARQLRRALPHATIEVFERAEDRGWKVGESTVEIASAYLTRRLGLDGYLFDQQLPKNGLRFFFDTPEKQAPFLDMSEIGTDRLPIMPAFQLDRARFETNLIEMDRAAGVPVHLGWAVRDLALGGGADGAPHTFVAVRGSESRKVAARWVVDAAGRASIIARLLDLRVEEEHPLGAVWARYRKVVDMDDLPPSFPDRAADVDGSKYAGWRGRVRHTARFLSTNHFCYRGYWIWLIPLARGVTSVGWVGTREGVWTDALRKEDGFRAFLDSHRAVRDLMVGSELLDIGSYKQLAYGTKRFLGHDRWACVGEAAAFSDPFYSPGSDYIAIENDMVTDLIVRDLAKGEPREERVARTDAYDQFLQFRFRATMLLYEDLYVTLGSFDTLLLKWNFDIGCYYNLWVDSYFKNEHLDLREVKSQLRRKDGVLDAIGASSRMFQEVVRELDRRGTYHQHNLGRYNLSADMMGCILDVGGPRSRRQVMETTRDVFERTCKHAEALAGDGVAREVLDAFEPFSGMAPAT